MHLPALPLTKCEMYLSKLQIVFVRIAKQTKQTWCIKLLHNKLEKKKECGGRELQCLQLKHVSQNARARACHCPLNARWLVHSLILSSQPNFGQIAKSGPPLCQFILKGTKSGQSGPESTITP